jgi:hypothetical protein
VLPQTAAEFCEFRRDALTAEYCPLLANDLAVEIATICVSARRKILRRNAALQTTAASHVTTFAAGATATEDRFCMVRGEFTRLVS